MSWHQEEPETSLEMAKKAGLTVTSKVIDVGGGTSRFVDSLLSEGVIDITVLDLSRSALDMTRQRLGDQGEKVTWVASNITDWAPTSQYDLWHDRAVFHFLVDESDRSAYLRNLSTSLRFGGHAIIATFALDGPEKCSGLPVVRYSPESLSETLGSGFGLRAQRQVRHFTPWGSPQSFQFSFFEKLPNKTTDCATAE
ncbi:MAG: class I SAM-dependent methyltransferase [Roseibium sp.]